jgi:uncharacterized membrane protein
MMLPNENRKIRPPKPVAWALFFSALLNLFLVGAFLGVMPHVKHKSFAPMALASSHGEYLVGWMTRYLDPSDVDAFRAAYAAQADALKQAHAHVHQATGNLASVFEQDPPDPAALQAALDRLAQARAEVNAAVGKALQTAYTKLSPEGRRRLADLTQNPL